MEVDFSDLRIYTKLAPIFEMINLQKNPQKNLEILSIFKVI